MNLINDDRIQLQVGLTDWEQVVRRSAALLERDGITTAHYVEAIFDSVRRNGTYMVIVPRVLLAHARPEEGATGTGLSLVTTAADVAFDGMDDQPVRMFFTLAATDADAHLDLMSHLATVLVDEDLFAEILTSTDPARVREILQPA